MPPISNLVQGLHIHHQRTRKVMSLWTEAVLKENDQDKAKQRDSGLHLQAGKY